MKKLEFTKEERTAMVRRIQVYFHEEMDGEEIGNIPAEMLLNFFTDVIGNYYYNRGLSDAHSALLGKVEEFADSVYSMEQPTNLRR